jgi:hypothetical protein
MISKVFFKKLILVTSFVLAIGCGKKVELDDLPNSKGGSDETTSKDDSTDPNHPSASSCGVDQMLHWSFLQPNETVNRSIDLLLVVDSSDSLMNERIRISSTLPSFINQLSLDVDYRIGVMLAHGGSSYYSGKLYSPSGVPKVLNSKTMSVVQVQNYLEKTLRRPLADVDEANGEMMMFSLLKSLESTQVSAIQSQGFYRSNAALAVVFVSDENDICYPPDMYGYKNFPDFVPSYGNTETTAYKKYCINKNNELLITPEKTYTKLKELKGTQPLAVGAVTHIDPSQVPPAQNGSEDSIGHGILELVKNSINGILMELAMTDYSDGMRKIGDMVTHQLHLLTQFELGGSVPFNEKTIAVQIDGKQVKWEYGSTTRLVTIKASDAGKSGSLVYVTACKK